MKGTIKLLTIITLSVLAGAYSTKYFSAPLKHSADLNALANKDETELLRARVDALLYENHQLQLMLEKHTAASSAPINIEDKVRIATTSSANTEQNQKLIATQNLDLALKANNFSHWLANSQRENRNFDIGKEMERRFQTEERDLIWAEQQEQELSALFTETSELAVFALQSAQCRTNQCQVSVSITDIEQANQIIQIISESFKDKNRYPLIISAPNLQQGNTTLYIEKDEKSFEFN